MFSKLFKKKDKFVSPITGRCLKLDDVPDAAFSSKAMGDGFAIEVKGEEIVSPIDGEVAVTFHTGHAYGIRGDRGLELLIHIGIDTVELNGEGFTPMVKQGDVVKQGQVIAKIDVEKVKSYGKSLISPILFTTGEAVEVLKVGEDVKINEGGIVRY